MNFENLKELEKERKSLPHSTGGRVERISYL